MTVQHVECVRPFGQFVFRHLKIQPGSHAIKCIGLRALLVEDNAINQQIAVELLDKVADIVVDIAPTVVSRSTSCSSKEPNYYDIGVYGRPNA